MNIFAGLTWRTMKKSRTRTIVTIVGVILATAMITAVLVLGLSVQQYMLNYAIRTDGNWHLVESTLSKERAEELFQDGDVEESVVIRELGYGDASFLREEEDIFRSYFYLQTISEEAADMLSLKLSKGRLPQNEHEIILQEYMLYNVKTDETYQIGDEITLTVGDRVYEGENVRNNQWIITSENGAEVLETFVPRYERTYTIVGILNHWGNTLSGGGGSDAFTGTAEGGETLKEDEEAPWQIYMRLNNPRKVQKVQERLEESAAPGTTWDTNRSVLEWMGISGNSAFVAIRNSVFAILISIIAAGSIFLIYNAFSISYRERVTQFGILASAGASRRQIRNTMLYEALFSGLIGIPLGILSGILGSTVTLHFIGNWVTAWINGIEEEMDVFLSLPMIAVTVFVVAVILLVSAWMPVKKSRKISPMDAIRSTKEIRLEPSRVKTSPSVYKNHGIEGMLGEKNYKRDRRKHRATVAALTMSILLFTSSALLAGYLGFTTFSVMEAPDYEVSVAISSSRDAEEYIQFIQEAGETEQIDSYRSLSVMADEYSGSIICLTDEEFEKYAPSDDGKPFYYDRVTEYNLEREKYEDTHMFQKDSDFQVDVHTSVYMQDKKGEYQEEKTFETTLEVGQYAEKIPSYVEDYSDFLVFIPESRWGEYDFPEDETWVKISVKTKEYNKISEALEEKLTETEEGYYVDNTGASYQRIRGIRLSVKILTYGFVILISLIAASSVFNTVSTNILLRKREFAMLRSMGMTKKMLWRMLRYECMIYTGKAVFYGFLGTMAVDILIYWSMTKGYLGIFFIIPWAQFLAAAVWSAAVVFFTMWMTVRKIDRENIIEELRKE